MYLDEIQEFVDAQNSTNSNTDKLNVLKKYADNESVRKALEYTYNTFKQYGVTSENCKKLSHLSSYGYSSLFDILNDLNSRYLTGHNAISAVNGFVAANKRHEDLIFSIIDRNLKTRSTASMINKVIPGLIPTFDVALANSFDEKMAKKVNFNEDNWYVSRKLDGCRCICIIDENGEPKYFSRAGNEFLFQMQALMNIELLNAYEVKKIVTCDPHSFNCLKNEYPSLGGNYEVLHHTQFIQQLLKEGRIDFNKDTYKGSRITFHDPCYLGRANNEYQAPREILSQTNAEVVEMKRSKSSALCCGAGGAQMFKEPEKGNMEINVLRTQDALETTPNIIATGCPYCNTMMTDGVKFAHKENEVKVLDIAEIIANAQNL